MNIDKYLNCTLSLSASLYLVALQHKYDREWTAERTEHDEDLSSIVLQSYAGPSLWVGVTVILSSSFSGTFYLSCFLANRLYYKSLNHDITCQYPSSLRWKLLRVVYIVSRCSKNHLSKRNFQGDKNGFIATLSPCVSTFLASARLYFALRCFSVWFRAYSRHA